MLLSTAAPYLLPFHYLHPKEQGDQADGHAHNDERAVDEEHLRRMVGEGSCAMYVPRACGTSSSCSLAHVPMLS